MTDRSDLPPEDVDDALIDDAIDPLPRPLPGRPFVTRYDIDLLPEGDDNHGTWALTLEYMGYGLWAVCTHHGTYCYSRDGTEKIFQRASWKADDETAFVSQFRMPLREALDLADRLLPDLKVNGYTAAEWRAENPDD